jgi:hypothetical protein
VACWADHVTKEAAVSGETFFTCQMILGFGAPLAFLVHQLWSLRDTGPQGRRSTVVAPPAPPPTGGNAEPLAPAPVASKPLPDCLIPKRVTPAATPARELEPA